MRRNILRAVLATGVAFISLPSSLAAHEFRVADLLIEHPWTRAVGSTSSRSFRFPASARRPRPATWSSAMPVLRRTG